MNNREIKFRVWDKQKNNFSIEPRLNISLLNCYPFVCDIATFGNPIQQYIGLKDRNGKEIYDGDVLKGFDFIAEVYWCEENAAFSIKSNTCGGAFLNPVYINNFEVIGNIFENPELLVGITQ
jgi:hypothetical protein